MLKEFREFVMRGNVIDLAVAVVIGAAFGAVVTALVETMITPLIAAIGGQPDFSAISFTINESEFLVGEFINALVSFLIIAAVVFFFVVKPMNALMERVRRSEETPDPTTAICNYCKTEIPLEAMRCPHCTSENPLAAAS
ncbi:MAG: large conductance mechanosensitive channel protein MscL [Chloroflexota bacterium]|nr:large conductance mechanosensitive channel protein MscL [Chloroflexota bacterium]